MQVVSARNPRFNADGSIDLLVTFEELGEVPFTTMQGDGGNSGPLWVSAMQGEFGPVAEYVAPVVVMSTPTSVTPRQAKIALLGAGLLDDVEAAIAAISDATQKRIAQIEWEYAQEIKRDWPLLNQVAAAMGMTDAQLDALFMAAAGL